MNNDNASKSSIIIKIRPNANEKIIFTRERLILDPFWDDLISKGKKKNKKRKYQCMRLYQK